MLYMSCLLLSRELSRQKHGNRLVRNFSKNRCNVICITHLGGDTSTWVYNHGGGFITSRKDEQHRSNPDRKQRCFFFNMIIVFSKTEGYLFLEFQQQVWLNTVLVVCCIEDRNTKWLIN